MILVFGKSGQVATELARQGDVTCLGRDTCDQTTPGAVAAAIAAYNPSVVLNAAAYTAVDKAEDEEQIATLINAKAVDEMARACASASIPLIHISTDYVFPGDSSTPWTPVSKTGPLGAYGRSKLAGEQAIRTSGVTHVILRTSWVVSAHGNNFVKTMLRLGADRDALTIVADQIGGPTPAADIAAACLSIARQLQDDPTKSGTYHFSGAPDVSWAGFARVIFDLAGLGCAVTDIPSSDYPTPAVRPLNSRMDCHSTFTTFGITRPDWKLGLDGILKDLIHDA